MKPASEQSTLPPSLEGYGGRRVGGEQENVLSQKKGQVYREPEQLLNAADAC